MAVACASRFSVLCLEDDVCETIKNKKCSANSSENCGPAIKTKQNSKNNQPENKNKSKKKKSVSEIAELQNLAFANTGKSKGKSIAGNSRAVNVNQKQWEEWKKKDTEYVSDAYEQDLQEALLLSKIDYEEKKDIYDSIKQESDLSKQILKKKKKNNQRKEKGMMSLDEFQSLPNSQIDLALSGKKKPELDDLEISSKLIPCDEQDFFHKIEEDAEKIIVREQRLEHLKSVKPNVESARTLQFQEEIRLKDEEICSLSETVTKLKDELKVVKMRNKKLYGILETGEMREKAEILVQIEQLLSVKDELTDQLKEYHTALEQERSKVHSLQMELKKYQNKKNRTESK